MNETVKVFGGEVPILRRLRGLAQDKCVVKAGELFVKNFLLLKVGRDVRLTFTSPLPLTPLPLVRERGVF